MTSNLTRTWLTRREASGDTRAAALRWLNAQTGAGYTSSRLNEWLRGAREPSRAVRIVMLRDIAHALPDLNDAEAWT